MKNGDTIKDIVRRGQDMLCDLEITAQNYDFKNKWINVGRPCHLNWGLKRATVVIDSPGLAQSLGELCLEIAQPKLFLLKSTLVADTPSFKEWVFHPAVNEQVRGDIQQLKQAMWHKHTDYTQEVARKWWEETVKWAGNRGNLKDPMWREWDTPEENEAWKYL